MRRNNRLAFTHPILTGALAAQVAFIPADIEQILNQPEWAGRDALLANLAASSRLDALSNTLEQPESDPRYHRTLNISRYIRVTPRTSPLRGAVLRSLAAIVRLDTQPMACACARDQRPGAIW